MRDWTWMNDNNKHKYKNSDSGNFSIMIKLKECMDFSFMVSHTVYFKGMMFFTLTSQMYHRISVLVPVLVRVPVHEYEYKYYDFGTHKYEYQKFSTRVLRVRVLSTSTPALIANCYGSVAKKLSWFIRHLSDGLDIFYSNLWNLSSDIWA